MLCWHCQQEQQQVPELSSSLWGLLHTVPQPLLVLTWSFEQEPPQWGPAAQEAPCALQVAVCVWAPHLGQAWALPHQEQRQLPA